MLWRAGHEAIGPASSEARCQAALSAERELPKQSAKRLHHEVRVRLRPIRAAFPGALRRESAPVAGRAGSERRAGERAIGGSRSEERRVGKECRSGWAP